MKVELRNWTISIDDGNVDQLMAAYDAARMHYIQSNFSEDALKVADALEAALVARGLLEAEPEEEELDERRDGATNYDEAYYDLFGVKIPAPEEIY